MKVNLNKKLMNLEVRKVSGFGKYSGLMFRTRDTDSLLFEFKNWKIASIHSFFVFFSFLAVWMDEKDKVVNFEVVRPFRVLVRPRRPSTKLIEIPINLKNRQILDFFVGKRKI